ncbi:hypothetical protein [Nitratireductor indicus]|uniref:hypothetical protein n=1 Tax=Nitratireductor indicus TaxID=721133 RepID=UPI0015A5B6B4|nr:hypothetical protein [Nitratireductor indicus]
MIEVATFEYHETRFQMGLTSCHQRVSEKSATELSLSATQKQSDRNPARSNRDGQLRLIQIAMVDSDGHHYIAIFCKYINLLQLNA